MNETFGYKVAHKVQGPDGTGIYVLKSNKKQFKVLFDEDWGIEIHPQDKSTEKDVIEIGAYLKEVLENQNGDSSED